MLMLIQLECKQIEQHGYRNLDQRPSSNHLVQLAGQGFSGRTCRFLQLPNHPSSLLSTPSFVFSRGLLTNHHHWGGRRTAVNPGLKACFEEKGLVLVTISDKGTWAVTTQGGVYSFPVFPYTLSQHPILSDWNRIVVSRP